VASPWGTSWGDSWGTSWSDGAPAAGNDAWGISWNGAWGLTWTGSEVTPTPGPRPPALGGFYAPRKRQRRFSRQMWEEMLADLERERQEAQERAEAFRGSRDRRQAKKAARAASEAIARAREAADEAAVAAHAGAITRMLEGAAQAKGIAEYLKQMEAARIEAEELEDEDEVETVLMLS
jgi:hypothetical protein